MYPKCPQVVMFDTLFFLQYFRFCQNEPCLKGKTSWIKSLWKGQTKEYNYIFNQIELLCYFY